MGVNYRNQSVSCGCLWVQIVNSWARWGVIGFIGHQDFATFQMEKTINEVYELYRGALLFLDFLPKELRKFSKDCYQSSS